MKFDKIRERIRRTVIYTLFYMLIYRLMLGRYVASASPEITHHLQNIHAALMTNKTIEFTSVLLISTV